jgi:hypothetical protein
MAESSSSNLLDWTITDAPPADEPLHAPDSSSSPRRTLTRHHNISVRLWLIVGSLIAVVIAGLWVFSALFQALSVAIGPVSWVAKGLGISSQEAQARLDAAFKRIQPAPR